MQNTADWVAYNPQKFISDGAGGWDVQGQEPAWLGEDASSGS